MWGEAKKIGGNKMFDFRRKILFYMGYLRLKAQNDYTLQKLGRGIAR